MRRIVLLPGLDGTGALFEGFVRASPPGVSLDIVTLPREPLSYEELATRLAPRLQLAPDTILLAESFSGPLAVLVAEHHQIAALVLCNTFVTPPRPRALAALPLTSFFHLPPPAVLVRRYLVGPGASDDLVAQVRTAVASVPPAVLAMRMSSVLTVDVARCLTRCTAPILYLRGTEDRLVPEASLRRVIDAASVPVSVARILGPHLLLQVAPEAAWRAVVDAVLRTPPPA